MYAIYKQNHPPTSVEHCLYCNFFSSNEKNLITAGVNQLTVYRLNSDVESRSQPEKSDVKVKKKKLECLGTYSLFGNVMCIQSVRLAGSVRDSLLLSFQEAKLALVDYDPTTHDLKTMSLHYFEEDDMKCGSVQHSFHIPTVRVDPEGRCAAMLIYGSKLVILPFRRDIQTDDLDSTASNRPIMSSYIIELTKFDEKICNVVDFQFLHGYYEPTIFILYEPLPTWAGRVAVRRDTCCIVAISLNIQQKVHPVIWSLNGLPFDCFQVLPVDKPIGGVLVFAVNSLFYLNQSVPPYGVSLNSLTDFSTEFLLKPQESFKNSLDCCQAAFIEHDKLVISLKNGELYVLTLLVDGMRAVRSFNFDKAAASVLTTCMIQCDDGYLFLGSRLGNSLLLKYTEKVSDDSNPSKTTKTQDKGEEPPSKKKKTEALEDWIASDVSALDDLDELEVYGKDTQTGVQITSFSFEVCDSILNIGPCGQMVVGEPAFLSEEFNNLIDPDLELVTTTGYGKNGALSVLQRSIRPQVVTTFELPGCMDMWTVKGPSPDKSSEHGNQEDDCMEGGDALLVMSREDSSMVLQTGQEIMELDHSGFSTQGPTVYAGNIGGNRYIVQVSPMGVRLLEGVKQLQHHAIDLGSPIVTCSVADPYVLIMSEAGQVMLLNLRFDQAGNARLQMAKTQLPQNSGILAMCAYRDVSGMFSTAEEDDDLYMTTTLGMNISPTKPPDTTTLDLGSAATVDDEDELLYGDSDAGFSMDSTKKEETKPSSPVPEEKEKEIKVTYWAVIGRENGSMEIYSMPELRLSFMVRNFPIAQRVLVDSSSDPVGEKAPIGLPQMKEILLVGLGSKGRRPYLMARVDEELLIYEAFRFTSHITNHLKLRFHKVPHGLILKERKTSRKKAEQEEDDEERRDLDTVKWLRPFSDISGYSGVFVCGPYPHWLIMTPRGVLRAHPMGIDGAITSFSPFHNINCPKGFLYFNRQGELRISVLPTHLSYDAPWPVRKVPLRCTPHFVVYHPESKTYSVISSHQEINNRIVRIQSEGDKEFETQERDERCIFPTMEKFSTQLFSPVSWEAIPNTRYELEDFEHITAAKAVNLTSEGTVSGLKGYIALGTNYSYSEDVTSRGRIIIYDVIDVVPEPGQPLTKNKMKIEYDKEQKGPVTALDHCQGFLVTAIGQKIYIWTLKDQDLSGVAFIDTQIYIHSITTIKSLILCSDIFKSISLLRYQTDMKVLSLVSRDIKHLEVFGANFMVDNTNLCFVASDRDKNVILYSYQPELRESRGGQRLLRRADFNVGSHINCFFRIRCKLTDPSTDKRAPAIAEKKHITYFSTLDGSLGYLLPISEKVYRRLLMLQNTLTVQMPHYAGLNPKAYRALQTEQKHLNNPQRNILDGDLLWIYLSLGRNEKTELAKRIGTSLDQIMDDLVEIDRYTAHF